MLVVASGKARGFVGYSTEETPLLTSHRELNSGIPEL